MSQPCPVDRSVPRLQEIGTDLLRTNRRQRWLAFARPFIGLAAYAVAVVYGWWWLTPLIVVWIFIAVVTVIHDVVHRSLGLRRRQTDWALFVYGAILLESGHSYRTSHMQHHRAFPGPDDPEGDPARMSFFQAILHGPIYLPRLWWWAFGREGDRAERCWLLAEAAWAMSVIIAAVALWPWTPAVLLYVVIVIGGSWLYPLLTVYLPHHNYGDTPVTQTGSLRGRLIPALFLEQTYHLEHHLYPAVPSHHLPELARRLDPYFSQAGVRLPWVP